ncbi:hypothetical protein AALP_AAs66174U000100 [Arabis alpina]|uniref:Uncharacterized protein n=1 Tax=Arabis alpina TaxID=50452 RepID=A0A087G047_ARAAL|nr:hypothetical protein AALP_AAs66174U000100 [Arabis alpina]
MGWPTQTMEHTESMTEFLVNHYFDQLRDISLFLSQTSLPSLPRAHVGEKRHRKH